MDNYDQGGDSIRERDIRLKKLEELKAIGVKPYPDKVEAAGSISEIQNYFKTYQNNKKEVIINGRIKSKREHGNLSFIHIEDDSGRIQVAFSKKEIGADEYKKFLKYTDIGDFISVTGSCFVTQREEESVMAAKWTMLAKAIRPLPDKWHGISDDDKRQRFRELEMISSPEVLNRFKRRSEAVKKLREFMWSKGFREIETPILQNVYGGTYAKPFITHYNALDFDLYIRIAPELFLKRSVVGGMGKVFEIGKCFRNEGMGPAHLQEFTMFEFYWPYADYEGLMEFTEELIGMLIDGVYGSNYKIEVAGHKINLKPPFKRIKFANLIEEKLGVKLKEIDTIAKAENFIKEKGLKVDISGAKSWSAAIDEIYKKIIRKNIIGPVFITDYPKEFIALAKEKSGDEATAATFQLVVNGWELIKAYNELNDPVEQKRRFEEQERLIMDGDEEAMPYDHDFVESMEYGMPPIAGWGMGLDRFFALLEEEENLRDMILFPTMKPIVRNDKLETANAEDAELGLSHDQAEKLVKKFITDDKTRSHIRESEIIMRALAEKFKTDEEKWGIIGLLHDIDWDLTKETIKDHTVKAKEILKSAGASDFLIESVVSHAYGNKECGENQEKKRSSRLQHSLVAAETVTGLIIAAALMQPDKKLASVKLSSLKKKFKQKAFAANCDRELILEIEKTGIHIDDFLALSLEALQKNAEELGF